MELLGKCLGIILLTAVCSALIRGRAGGIGLVLPICGCGAVLLVLAPQLRQLTDWFGQTAALFGGKGLLVPLLRCLGIALTVRLTAEICRDAGERALAVKAEIAGAICGLVTVLPLLQQVLELVSGL